MPNTRPLKTDASEYVAAANQLLRALNKRGRNAKANAAELMPVLAKAIDGGRFTKDEQRADKMVDAVLKGRLDGTALAAKTLVLGDALRAEESRAAAIALAERGKHAAPVPLKTLLHIPTVGEVWKNPSFSYLVPTSSASPIGEGVIFLSDESGSQQLWFKPTDGKARQLAKFDGYPFDPALSADEKTVYCAPDNGGDEVSDICALDLATGKITNLTSTTKVIELSARQMAGNQIIYLSDEGHPWQYELCARDLATGATKQLTKSDGVLGLIASPDGKKAVVTASADYSNGTLQLVDVITGKVAPLKAPGDPKIVFGAGFSPDSKTVLGFAANAKGIDQMVTFDVKTKKATFIGPDDHSVEDAVWSANHGIVFSCNVSGRNALYQMAAPGAPVQELLAPEGDISDLHATADGKVIFAKSSSTQPSQLMSLDLTTKKLDTIYAPAKAVPTEKLSAAQPFKVKSTNNTTVEGLFFEPKVARRGKPYPLVTLIHGGPDAQSRENFDPLIQALTQDGIAVITPNYRGSTGYGQAFRDADNFDWGRGDREDLRAAAQHFIDLGKVDSTRIVPMGGSFGGYLTLMCMAKDADFYAGGIDMYGMTDLVMDYELTKDRFADWYHSEMGSPATAPTLFADRSPLQHIDEMKKPLLIIHGENDPNVPIKQSEKLTAELKKKGKDVKLIRIPNEGHGFVTEAGRTRQITEALKYLDTVFGSGG